eukprot:6186042-Pleurochrysis_carterae.AAC.1
MEKRQTAKCLGGSTWQSGITERKDGRTNWKYSMNGLEAEVIHRTRELITESIGTCAEHMTDDGIDELQQTWDYTWNEFLIYAQRGNRGAQPKKTKR